MFNISKINLIAKYTFQELMRSKIFYGTLAMGLGLVIVTFVATEFTYGVPEKVAIDFGLGLLSLTSLGISLFMGTSLLTKEIDSRTVYMVISRPVSRSTFILGKILGLFWVQILNFLFLSSLTILITWLLGGAVGNLIYFCILFILLESLLLLVVVIFFSLFMNSLLAGFVSFLVLLLGHAAGESQSLLFVQSRPLLLKLLSLYHLILPGFYKLNLKDFVVYNQHIESSYLASSFFYGALYITSLICLTIFLFNKKNLD